MPDEKLPWYAFCDFFMTLYKTRYVHKIVITYSIGKSLMDYF